jgi:uncharacterized membrane protein
MPNPNSIYVASNATGDRAKWVLGLLALLTGIAVIFAVFAWLMAWIDEHVDDDVITGIVYSLFAIFGLMGLLGFIFGAWGIAATGVLLAFLLAMLVFH